MSTDKGTSDGRAGVSRTLAFGGEDDDTAASHGDQVVSGGEEHGVTPVREQSSREGALVSPPLTGDSSCYDDTSTTATTTTCGLPRRLRMIGWLVGFESARAARNNLRVRRFASTPFIQ